MRIIYTHTDEAPALATHSLLPILRAYAGAAGSRDRAARHLAGGADPRPVPRPPRPRTSASPTPSPNSASSPRRPRRTSSSCPTSAPRCPSSRPRSPSSRSRATRSPTTPRSPADDEQREVRARYDRVKGSAVNPVLRQGNSDRRAPPRSRSTRAGTRTRWAPGPRLALARRDDERRRLPLDRALGDGRRRAGRVRIEHVDSDGDASTVLKDSIAGARGRGPRRGRDARARRSTRFLAAQIAEAREQGRAVLGAPEGDDDEGLRPDHLRARGARVLPGRLRDTATRSPPSASTPTTASARCRGVESLPNGAEIRRDRARLRRARRSRWSTPTAGSPTCTCPAT